MIGAIELFHIYNYVGEGTQRLCFEHKVRLGKIEAIQLTRCEPLTVGGLAGLSLTAADAGKESLSIIGPRGLNEYWNQISNFAYRPDFQIKIFEIGTDAIATTLTKGEISIEAVLLTPDVVAYLCKTPHSFGKFDVVKASNLKVPKGPMFGRLKGGHSITLIDGTVVTPDQVLGKPDISKYICIVGNLEGNASDLDSSLNNKTFDQ